MMQKNKLTSYHGSKIWWGNCIDLLGRLADSSVDMVLTSPPYNLGKEYESYSTTDKYIEDQRSVIEECSRVLRPGGNLCWQVGNHVGRSGHIIPLDMLLYATFASIDGLVLRNRIIWAFSHGQHCQKRFSGRYETVLWYSKGEDYTFNLDPVRVPQKYQQKKSYRGPNKGQKSCNPLGKNPGDVWYIPNVCSNHSEKTCHPCQFPVALAETLILSLSNTSEVVLDPYLGAGTTAAVAVANGRFAIGAEIKKSYVTIAQTRILQAKRGELPHRPRWKPIDNNRDATISENCSVA